SRLRCRDDQHGCRAVAYVFAAEPGAFLRAWQRKIWPAVPVQSRSAAADRCGDRHRTAQDPKRLGQSAARAGAGAGLTSGAASILVEDVEPRRTFIEAEFRPAPGHTVV